MPVKMQIFTFLSLMIGPFKIIGPFANITKNATPEFARKLAFRAALYSAMALLIAALLGENILRNYGIPLPILSMAGGIILFLVALLNVIKQFSTHKDEDDLSAAPTLNMAMYPLAFPTIVTPYGIAAVIVFLAISPDMESKLTVGGIVLGIMLLNLVVMLLARHIFKTLAIVLAILGSVLAVVQVALGLLIIYNQFKVLLKG
jgi:multiple antibiotic resistance protein